MIQLLKLRGNARFICVQAPTVQDVINDSADIAKGLSEPVNIFYTLAHHTKGKRTHKSFESQDVLPFDIDGIDHAKTETYIEIICRTLGLDVKTTGIIASGNGLHLLVRITPITDVKYFQKFKPAYKKLCTEIDSVLKSEGLPGNADPVVFEPARIFRLPNTKNIKEKNGKTIIKDCTIINAKMEQQEFELVNPIEDDQMQWWGPIFLKHCRADKHPFRVPVISNGRAIAEQLYAQELGLVDHAYDENCPVSRGQVKTNMDGYGVCTNLEEGEVLIPPVAEQWKMFNNVGYGDSWSEFDGTLEGLKKKRKELMENWIEQPFDNDKGPEQFKVGDKIISYDRRANSGYERVVISMIADTVTYQLTGGQCTKNDVDYRTCRLLKRREPKIKKWCFECGNSAGISQMSCCSKKLVKFKEIIEE